MISSPVVAPRLIGRDDECAFLMRRLDEAVRGGDACVVRVEGEPGMGKTRLIGEVRRRAGELNAVVVAANGLERVNEPYAAFVLGIARAVDAYAESRDDAADLRAIAGGLDPSAALQKAARLATVAAAARRLVRRRPLALIVDDAHWVDDASLDLVAFLAGELAGEAFFVLTAARPEGRPALEKRLRGAHVVLLRALADRDVATLLREALRDRGRLEVERLRRIVALAEGNPLFALELLRDALAGADDAATPSFAYPIVERWEPLDAEARETLLLAAAFGEIDVAGLAAVAGSDAAAVEEALERAERLDLIGRDAKGWRFHHALARTAIEALLPARRRADVHRRIGMLLESRADVESARLAYHWRFAGDAERTQRYEEAAGDRARALHDYRAAADFFERALTAQPDGADAGARLNEKLAAAALGDGDAERARAPLDAALHAYANAGDGAGQARLLLLRSRLRWFDGAPRDALEDAERALALVAPAGASSLLFAVRVRLAQIHQLAGRTAEAKRQLEAAEALRAHGDPERVVVFLNTRAMLRADAWDDRFLDDYAEAIALAESIAHVELVVSTKNNLGLNAFLTGRRETALSALESSTALSYELAMRWHTSNDLLSLARVRYVFGDVRGARAALVDALAVAPEPRRFAAWAFACGVPIALDAGDDVLLARIAADETLLARTLAGGDHADIGYVTCAFVRLREARGETSTIPALLSAALDALGPAARPLFLCAEVARCGAPGDVLRARALLEAGPRDVSRAAERALFDSYAARRAKRRAEAVRCASLAAERYGELSWELPRARALEVAERHADALRAYRTAGCVRDVERLERAGHGDDPLDALTPREREVAALALDGRSNREIAARLGLSERTVGNHLQSVFNRLGIGSRRELGALAAAARD